MSRILPLHTISSRLDRVFEISKKIHDDEIKSHYSKYLCVLLSGFIEESLKVILLNYTSNKSHPNVWNYVDLSTQNLSNLNAEKLGIALNQFCSQWKDKYDACLTGEEKDSIDSVVANRHQIAHGKNVGVTFTRVESWYTNIKRVIEKVNFIVNEGTDKT